MPRALRATMTVYGAIGVLFGLSYVLFPRQMSTLQGAETLTPYLLATKMALGASIIPVGGFGIVAGQKPLEQLFFVRFVIAFALLYFGVAVYSGLVLHDDLGQSVVGLIIHGVATVALLVFYPWRRETHGASS